MREYVHWTKHECVRLQASKQMQLSVATYIVKDHVVCRYPISRDKEQCLVVDLEDLAHLAGRDLLEAVLLEVDLGHSC